MALLAGAGPFCVCVCGCSCVLACKWESVCESVFSTYMVHLASLLMGSSPTSLSVTQFSCADTPCSHHACSKHMLSEQGERGDRGWARGWKGEQIVRPLALRSHIFALLDHRAQSNTWHIISDTHLFVTPLQKKKGLVQWSLFEQFIRC